MSTYDETLNYFSYLNHDIFTVCLGYYTQLLISELSFQTNEKQLYYYIQ